jgi:hypothetical protein
MSVLINASTSSGLIQSADTSGEIELQSNGTTALKVNTNEGIQILNCLGVGNATPSTSGAGITFPATASPSSNANTLDDYEEGTWTPFIDSSGAGTGRATSVSGATYVKVGRQVTVKTYCTLTTFGSGGSGWIKISGLPFVNSDDGAYAACSVGFFTNLKANLVYVCGTIDPNGSWFEMRGLGSAGSATGSLDWTVYAQVNMGFIISASYLATA